MVGYLVLVPKRLLENLPWFAETLMLRAAHAQDGRTGHNIEYYRDLARRAMEAGLLLNAAVLGGILRGAIQRARCAAEKTDLSPWAKRKLLVTAPRACDHAVLCFRALARLLEVLRLVRPFLSADAVLLKGGGVMKHSDYVAQRRKDADLLFKGSLNTALRVLLTHWEAWAPAWCRRVYPEADAVLLKGGGHMDSSLGVGRLVHNCKELVCELPAFVAKE